MGAEYMGSLSLTLVVVTPELIRMKPVFLVLVLSSLLGLAQMNTAIIKYLGSNFILPDGCPRADTDDVVRRFYNLCLSTQADTIMCESDRLPNGRVITIPKFTNMCSAICQGVSERSNIQPCPHKGRKMDISELEEEEDQRRRNRINSFDFFRAFVKVNKPAALGFN